jgi:DNA repair exonuclease SbcCD nuclease subunit
MVVKLLHAADLHIDSPLRGLPDDGLAEAARLASRRAFERLIDCALAEGVAVVLLAGDVFDRDWRDAHTGIFFVKQVARLTERGVKVFMVLGNHDAAGTLSRRLVLPAGATVFGAGREAGSVDLPELGIAVHGWSFPVAAVTDDPLPRFPPPVAGRFNVGLLHTNLDGAGGHDNYAPTRSAALLGHGYDYWALGHVHARAVIRDGRCAIVYPGNLQGRHVREAVPQGEPGKGATLVTVEDGRISALAHQELDVLQWRDVRVDVSGAATADAALRDAAHAVAGVSGGAGVPVAVRVRLEGRTDAHGELLARARECRQELMALLGGQGNALLEELRLDTQPKRPPVDDALHRALATVLARVDSDPEVQARLRDAVCGGLEGWEGREPALARVMEATIVGQLRAPGGQSTEAVKALAATAHDVLRARLGGG